MSHPAHDPSGFTATTVSEEKMALRTLIGDIVGRYRSWIGHA
ncbi:hypothetical protein [Pseudenterobacter timonensis]|nr:hypothetical protein [Pseudenterobacter timonensis]